MYQSKEKLKDILKEYGFNKVGFITKEDYVYEGRGRKPKDTSKKQLKFTPCYTFEEIKINLEGQKTEKRITFIKKIHHEN